MRIDHIEARAVADSHGRPTVETTIAANALTATASVPSGESTGAHEACELRDPDGGVQRAIENVNGEIARAIVGKRFETPDDLDAFLIEFDGTANKARLGANAILAVSIAAMRLSALLKDTPLWKAIAERAKTTPSAPRLFVNMIEGGAHVAPAVASAKAGHFKLPFQEHLFVIEGAPATTVPAARDAFSKLGELLWTLSVHSHCGHLVSTTSTHNTPMGDEGGYAPAFDTLERPFELLAELAAGYAGASISIDVAASELFHSSGYELLGKSYVADELLRLYENLAARFPLHSIEDPFAEDATDDFARITAALGATVLIVGDDFTVTNPARIRAACEAHALNAVIIKPNQIGTVKETLEAVQAVHAAGLQAICSHRAGETTDTFIADLAYGVGAHGLKAGGFGQTERLVKYERLLAIEQESKK